MGIRVYTRPHIDNGVEIGNPVIFPLHSLGLKIELLEIPKISYTGARCAVRAREAMPNLNRPIGIELTPCCAA